MKHHYVLFRSRLNGHDIPESQTVVEIESELGQASHHRALSLTEIEGELYEIEQTCRIVKLKNLEEMGYD